jgi:hypothetical protein
VAEFGFGNYMREGVLQLRISARRYPELAFWVRVNRARRGDFKPGDLVPDIAVAAVAGAKVEGSPANGNIRLRDLVPRDGRPLGIIALSYS